MTSIRIAPSVRSAFSSDGAVLMEIKSGMMFASNPVGGRILELMAKGATSEEVVEAISKECNVSKEIVLRDLKSFTDQLRALGLLENDAPNAE
jgi:Coenzyme PQQ synthesis protein D (PqqD)